MRNGKREITKGIKLPNEEKTQNTQGKGNL